MRIRIPKVNFGVPAKRSVPMVPRNTPKAAIIRALTMEPRAMKVRTTSPQQIRAKYSGNPKARAKLASGGATTWQGDDAEGPGDEGAEGAIPRAAPALPLRAIW